MCFLVYNYFILFFHRERDVNIVIRGEINDLRKEAGLEVKWNANRDPSQKVWVCL